MSKERSIVSKRCFFRFSSVWGATATDLDTFINHWIALRDAIVSEQGKDYPDTPSPYLENEIYFCPDSAECPECGTNSEPMLITAYDRLETDEEFENRVGVEEVEKQTRALVEKERLKRDLASASQLLLSHGYEVIVPFVESKDVACIVNDSDES